MSNEMRAPHRLLLVVGARPNFMKMAPIMRELRWFAHLLAPMLVHTGQHYDEAMSAVFFEELGLQKPDIDLGVGSGSHAQQTAAIMAAFEPIVLATSPALVVVVGDVNSTVACALVAAKLNVRVAHVEAGLRSFDRTMPEEINRIVTDQLSDLLFVTERSAQENLLREGIAPEKIHFAGNVMIDTLLRHRVEARMRRVPQRFGLEPGGYALLTLHRPANVDDPAVFERIVEGLTVVAQDVPVLFPVHPRTRPSVERSAGVRELARDARLRLLDPLGYMDFLGLMADSAAVLTDSGGIQEETTVLGIPCLTLRDNTERPATTTEGTNTLVGSDPARIAAGWHEARERTAPPRVPALWDGKAAERIVAVLRREFETANHRPVAVATTPGIRMPAFPR